jgi:hypothetical protein
MGKRGPSKGHGGRPRKPRGTNAPRAGDGYKRRTVGPKSKGTQVYEHRAVKGAGPGTKSGKGGVVHHKDHDRGNNAPSNLAVVSKRKNRTA